MNLRQMYGAILALTVMPCLCAAQPPAPTSGLAENAALQYWPAFNWLPQNDADLKKLEDWRHLPLDANSEKLISSLRYLHAGARIKECDWGVDLSQGPYTLLPFLNKSRPLTRQACLKVRFDIAQKKWADAAEVGGDALVAARHLARPPIMISLLVSYANERDAIDALSSGLKAFDREALASLTKRLDALPPAMSLEDSLKVESHLSVDWTVNKIRSAGPNPDWHEILGFLEIGDEGKPVQKRVPDLVKEAGGTADSVARQFENLLGYYKEAQKLATASLSQAQFAKQTQELAARYASNPFAGPILPALDVAHSAVVAEQTRMVLLRAAIAVVQNGPEAVKQFTDPDHQPITYEANGAGFQLSSKVVYRNQPVTLTVGALQ